MYILTTYSILAMSMIFRATCARLNSTRLQIVSAVEVHAHYIIPTVHVVIVKAYTTVFADSLGKKHVVIVEERSMCEE